ncbi:hypothetical protein ACFP81_10345 [Deinococcus lacus]|uniref:Uncharacterized protein n=1 Tax=Deinococcus lacus TaxID=392561 RepID=A0ABW1YHL2_9DEIO
MQHLALYRTDGTLVWTATLPPAAPPIPSADTPPLSLAVQGEVGILARPALGGGSEMLRVAPTEVGGTVATSSDPVTVPAVRDLAALGTQVYAATDTGVQPLTAQGLPNSAQTLAAFGPARVDRLWASQTGSGGRNLLAAWRDPRLLGTAAQPLRLWDGVSTAENSARTAGNFYEIRDLTFAPDGWMYLLTPNELTSYDTVLGLGQDLWRARTVLSGLQDAQAVTWLPGE